jgi:hypothetical protein
MELSCRFTTLKEHYTMTTNTQSLLDAASDKLEAMLKHSSIEQVSSAIAAQFNTANKAIDASNTNLMQVIIKQSTGLAVVVQNSKAHKELGKALQTSLESKAHLSKESARTIAIKLTRIVIYLTNGHEFKALSNYNAAYMEARNTVVSFWVSKASKDKTVKPSASKTLAPELQAANKAMSTHPESFVAQLPHAVQIAACIALLKKLNVHVPKKLATMK